VNIYARTIRYFRPFALATAGGVGLTLVSIGFNLLKPWPFKFIVDGVLDSSAGTAETRVLLKEWFGATSPSLVVFWLCLAMVLISLLAGLVNLGSNYLFVRVGLQSLLKLRTDLYTALQNLPQLTRLVQQHVQDFLADQLNNYQLLELRYFRRVKHLRDGYR